MSAAIRTLAAGAILLALGLTMALLVARQITGPIAALRQLAGAGDGAALAGGASTGLRETDEVARALIAAEADRDASERDKTRARAALGESEEKLRQSQKMEAVGQLTGGLAHDFNNLLLVIIGNLDDLIDSKNNAPAEQELARQALEAAQRGADLIRSLLAFARRQPLQPRRVAHQRSHAAASPSCSRARSASGSRSRSSSPPSIWPVVADPAQLEAALTNLATNARDAMPRGGRLTIATANRHLDEDYVSQHAEVTPGDYAMIEVSDTGSGMPPELLAQIFDPFFTTKAPGEGTGLGLSMVFGFIKQSGGHINVYSEPGAGTTFRLYLPRDRTGGPARPGERHGGEPSRRRRDRAGGRGQSHAPRHGGHAAHQARLSGAASRRAPPPRSQSWSRTRSGSICCSPTSSCRASSTAMIWRGSCASAGRRPGS